MIKTKLKSFLLTFVCILFSTSVWSQSIDAEDTRLSEVSSLIAFYKYMLNTVGASKTGARDKEVIITESYKKAFLSSKVQIEDDLLPNRNAISNKDVTGYLRDVDFFFREIVFEFNEIQIEKSVRENGTPFYLVSFESKIDATTLEGDPYKDISRRFLEINLDEANNDLKIASVYTTKISREKQLRNWWESLSYEWIRIFQGYVTFDSISDPVLMRIAAIDSLNLSGNEVIQNLEPLSALSELKVLYINDTKVEDLNPIRYSLKLNKLVADGSNLQDIGAVQYFGDIHYLDVSNTRVRDITELSKLKHLTHLDLSGSNVVLFDPLQELASLTWLDVSNTPFSNTQLVLRNAHLTYLNASRTGLTNLKDGASLKELQRVDASETYLMDLAGLGNHPSLKELRINQTRVKSLALLETVPKLEKVYADYTGISEKAASDFMSKRKNVVVITNSEKVLEWWSKLDLDWKMSLKPFMKSDQPEKEDLIKLLNIDSLDLSNNQLVNAEPLEKFRKLRYLDVSKNLFVDFSFTADMEFLETLIARKLATERTIGLEKNKSLNYLDLKGSIVLDIRSLHALNKLETVDLTRTRVQEQDVKDFLLVNPKTVILYQEEALNQWWASLSSEWIDAFGLQSPGSYELHRLIESSDLVIENVAITSLSALDVFISLRKLTLNRTQITSLNALIIHKGMEEISCTNGPLSNLEGMDHLSELKYLNLSNTAVENLQPIHENYALMVLNCSGTNIKKLKGLEDLKNLEKLDISNTSVWQLDRLYDIRELKTLVCYNTRIRSRHIDEFKEQFTECDVTYY